MPDCPQPAASPREQEFTLLAVALSIGVIAYNTTAISTALLAIKRDLHLSAEALLWVVSGYLVTAAVLIIFGGESGDLFGHRRMFAAGSTLFALASVLIATSEVAAMVLTGRILQGAAAAILLPGGITILELTFPPERRAFALGVWGGVAGLALGLGPVLGGLLTHYLTWRWIFWFNLPILLVILFLLLVVLKKDAPLPKKQVAVDGSGLLLVVLTLGPFIFAVSQIPSWGLVSPRTLALLGLSAASGIVLLHVERRKPEPLIRLSLFRSSQFVAGICGNFVVLCVLFTFLFFFNLYVQGPAVFGYSAAKAGWMLLPLNASVFLVSLAASRIALRFGYRLPVALSMLAMAGGLFLISAADTGTPYLELAAGLVLLGAGLGFAFSSCPHVALKAVPPEIQGRASGLVTTFNYTGGSLGVAFGSLIHHFAALAAIREALSPLGLPGTQQEALLREGLHGTVAQLTAGLASLPLNVQGAAHLALQQSAHSGFHAVALLLCATSLLGAAATFFLLRKEPVTPSAEHLHPPHHSY